MNPNTRQLIRLTYADVEEELEKFRVLHGTDSDKRKELMKFFKINIEDLDN